MTYGMMPQELLDGTLPKTSYVRCHKVFCLQKIHDKFVDLVQIDESE